MSSSFQCLQKIAGQITIKSREIYETSSVFYDQTFDIIIGFICFHLVDKPIW